MIEVARDQRNVDVAALADGLAVVDGLQHGETARVLLHLARERIEITGALMSAERLPAGQGFARGFNGSIYIGGIAMRDFGDLVAGRWIAGCEVLAAGGLLPRAVDVVAEVALMRVEPALDLFGVFRRRTVFHAVELFND